MTAILGRVSLFVLLVASGCTLGSTANTATQPAAVAPDAAVSTQIAAEPTPSGFDVDPTDMAAAQESADAVTTSETTGEPMGTVPAGEFRLTIDGDTQFTFDSAGTTASAAVVDQGETALLRFRLGADGSSLFAQEIGIVVPADIAPGEFLLRGNFGLGALTGEDDDSSIPMEGRVTIETVTANSISGTFEFTATTGGTQPTVVAGTFNQIPRVTE